MMMLVVCVEKESRQKPAPPAIRKERQTKLVRWTVVSVDSVELTSNKFAVSLITAADYELGGGIIKRYQLNLRVDSSSLESSGLSVLITPKFHCEFAGEGMEYNWTFAKTKMRMAQICENKGD